MKRWVFLTAGLLSLCFSATAVINSASEEVLKMANQGVSQDVIQQYINGSTATYNLNADDILYLQQSGVPQPVISSMISHDNAIAQNGAQPNNTQPQSQQAPPPDQTVQQQVNPPDVYAQNQQDQQVMQVAPEQAPPQVNSFYNSLQPYGNWIYLEGYGWCWQPYVVQQQSNWQPYCDNGSWLYCNDGWYWQSYYNWGWAPFHYGRWWHANCGWVWFPDTVWAPSWVCWRNYGDYCGWAPLPPSGFYGYGQPGFHFGVGFNIGLGAGLFTFIHLGDIFHGGHGYGYRHYEIPHNQVTQIYNRTRVINNVTVVNNNYARNPGIPRQTVERVAGPVHVTPVRTTTADPRTTRPGVVQNGSQVAIVRPERVPTTTRTTTPIVGHRLPANARTVPATTPVAHENRTTARAQNPSTSTATPQGRGTTTPQGTTTYSPLQTPRTTATPRNPSVAVPQSRNTTEVPRATNPRVNEVPHTTNPQAHEVPRPTEQPRVTETPRPTTHPTEVPKTAPPVSEVPKSTHVTEVPRPAPHVTEVPKPTPHVTEVPHSAPARTATPEVHRAYPEAAPRVQAPVAHEPAGARPAPMPRVEAPAHPVAPPPSRPSTAPGIERHSSPPPGFQQAPRQEKRDH